MVRGLNSNKKGFTIIELMVAMSVFSVVLLLCMQGFLRIGQAFYKGAALSRTQDNARVIMDEIAGSIRMSGGGEIALMNNVGLSGYCIGNKTYTFHPPTSAPMRSTPDSAALRVQEPESGGCRGLSLSAGREMVDNRMRLERLEINRISEGLYRVVVRVVQGEDDLIDDVVGGDGFRECIGGSGSHFCAVSELETTVQRRI